MSSRIVGLVIVSLLLVACGGGGTVGPPTISPMPIPTPARPATNGDTFAYAGSLTRGFTRNPEPGQPLPTPVQTNSQSFTSAVTQSVAVSTGVTYNGVPNLTDFKILETDIQTSPARTTTVTTDSYASYPATTGGIVRAVATVSTTSDGASFTTTFGPDSGVIDVLPEMPGPIVPANSASLVTTERDPDGTTTTRATKADGSYLESSTYPDGTSATATENADGTGTYSLPLFGFGSSKTMPTTSNTVLSVGAVVAAGIPPLPLTPVIPIAIAYSPAIFAPSTPPPINRTVADWYPGGGFGIAPPKLSSETSVDNGLKAFPAACAVPANFGTSGDELVKTDERVDVLFGETETIANTSYVSPLGVVCTIFTDSVTQYYDYSGQTVRALATYGVPLQVTTTAETLGLTGQSLRKSQSVAILSREGSGAAPAPSVGILQGLMASVERRRLERHAAARRFLRFAGVIR